MNKQRRKDIEAIIESLRPVTEIIEAAIADTETVRDDEQDYFDNMPEGLQYNSEKGEMAQAAIAALEEALSALEDFDLDSITGSLEEAQA